MDLQPIAIVLQLVRPAWPGRRLLGDDWLARVDECGGRITGPTAGVTPQHAADIGLNAKGCHRGTGWQPVGHREMGDARRPTNVKFGTNVSSSLYPIRSCRRSSRKSCNRKKRFMKPTPLNAKFVPRRCLQDFGANFSPWRQIGESLPISSMQQMGNRMQKATARD